MHVPLPCCPQWPPLYVEGRCVSVQADWFETALIEEAVERRRLAELAAHPPVPPVAPPPPPPPPPPAAPVVLDQAAFTASVTRAIHEASVERELGRLRAAADLRNAPIVTTARVDAAYTRRVDLTTTPLPPSEVARLRALVTEPAAAQLLKRTRANLGTSKSEFNAYMLLKSPSARAHFLPLMQDLLIDLQWPPDFVEWEAAMAPKPKKKANVYKSYREIWVQEHLWVFLLGFLRADYEVSAYVLPPANVCARPLTCTRSHLLTPCLLTPRTSAPTLTRSPPHPPTC